MEAYAPPGYLRELRRARRRNGARFALRVAGVFAASLGMMLLLLAGIGYMT